MPLVQGLKKSRFNLRLSRIAGCAMRTESSQTVGDGAHGAPYSTFSLLCVLMLSSEVAATNEQNKVADAAAEDIDSAWKYIARLNKFERQFSTSNDDQHAEWGGFIVVGNDPSAFWLTTKGTTKDGTTDSAEIRLFYSYRIAPYIGVQLGWRRDIEPEPNRDWLGFGLLGVLPYKIGVDASFFVGESDRLAARLEVAYKYWFTPRLSLTPDLEANFYNDAAAETSTGSGLSDLDLGLRVRYRVLKGVSPYAGVTWKRDYADTGDNGEDAGDLRLLLGLTLGF
jgi:copper resistance protein B